jgi:hypothetical protein
MPGRFASREGTPVALNGWLGGPQGLCGRSGKGNSLLLLPAVKPLPTQPVIYSLYCLRQPPGDVDVDWGRGATTPSHLVSRGAPCHATLETPISEGRNYGREMACQFGL